MDPRHQSRRILDGPDRAPARSYFKAVGFTDGDLTRPLVGFAHCWFSGATHGFMAGHVAPEAAAGGPLAAVRNGDVVFDVKRRRLDVELSAAELKKRMRGWEAAEAPLCGRRAGEVRPPRLLRLRGRRHRLRSSGGSRKTPPMPPSGRRRSRRMDALRGEPRGGIGPPGSSTPGPRGGA
jgi:hypothetical protein